MAHRIVIVGGGFGGAYCARRLDALRRRHDLDVLLIDRNNFLVFYPLLVEAGTGHLEPRHVVVPIRSFLRGAKFRMAEVAGVDLDRREVAIRPALSDEIRTVSYDHLVLSPGSVTRLPPVPGLREHGFEMKSLTDAVALRDRAIRMLEAAEATDDPERRAALLHFVVVGANFTGAELAGELHVFVREAAGRFERVGPDDCRVTLVELADRILPALDEDLSEFARRHMERRGIEIRLNTSIRELGADHVVWKDGGREPAGTVIWCAGIAPPPILEKLDLPVDERGYVLCERDLRVRGREDVWAIGDCAVNPDADGNAYPATAQHATRQGRHAADNIARALSGEATTPFDFTTLGSIVALGCRSGVARVMGFKLAGFPAWWLYRTVYLMKMPGLGRKTRVALDWTLDLLFTRDHVQLGVHRAGARTADGPFRSV